MRDSDPGKEALPSCDLRTFIVNQFLAFCGLLLFPCESRVALLCVVPPFLAQDSLVEGSSRAEQFSAGSSRHQLPHGAAEPAARAAAERRCKGAALPRRAGTLQQGLAWEGAPRQLAGAGLKELCCGGATLIQPATSAGAREGQAVQR